MRGKAAGRRADRPTVRILIDRRWPLGDDRLERDHQAVGERSPRECAEEVRHGRTFVQRPPDAMPAEVVNDDVTPTLDLSLDGPTDLGNAHAGDGGLESALERRACAARKIVRGRRYRRNDRGAR